MMATFKLGCCDFADRFALVFFRFGAGPHVLGHEYSPFEDPARGADQRGAPKLLPAVREVGVEIDGDLARGMLDFNDALRRRAHLRDLRRDRPRNSARRSETYRTRHRERFVARVRNEIAR